MEDQDHGSGLIGDVWNYSWLTELSLEELNRLRVIVKKNHMWHYPNTHMDDYEADKIIAAMGPKVAESQIKQAVENKIATAKIYG